jgi:hypothetical protein
MAQIPENIRTQILGLLPQLLIIIDQVGVVESKLINHFQESKIGDAIEQLLDIKSRVTDFYQNLCTFMLRTAQSHIFPADILEKLPETLQRTELSIAALEQSVQEIQIDWSIL